LEALLPPPICAVPVELDALLFPCVTEAGEPAVAVVFPAPTLALGFAACGDTCTAPVEPDAELLPPLAGGSPVGADTLALVFCDVTVAVGLAATEPTWTAPVEFVAVFPGSASAGAAVPRVAAAAQTPATRPRALRFIVLSLSRVGSPVDRRSTGAVNLRAKAVSQAARERVSGRSRDPRKPAETAGAPAKER
jgi:hypothetical protein